ncbi:MAG: 1-deoxy-D-xylulose-5-phosphate reductoisomerase [Desulfomonile tiedjei]|nr:1-deoxy-D-xylulose-5-phosphate reductoisomerase [Desulfomonile tiedjei]
MKGISILGSTGSIGIQTLDIVRLHPDTFRVVAVAAGSNLDLLEQQTREFHPSLISCGSEKSALEMKQRLADYSGHLWIGHSAEGLETVATAADAEIVVAGLPGSTGLQPTFAAVHAGKDVALATKEVLVMAGALFMATVRKNSVNLLPVDSEQSAIFQCLQGNQDNEIRRIILTASGGPFRDMPESEMGSVTREQALNHPRWKMGPKVTVDSASLMNKGLEVIEAAWLFDVPGRRIEVVVHPQSIVHSMVEFKDGSIMAQLGATDMRIPIGYALAFPQRITSGTEALDFPRLGSLTFLEPDWSKFPLLKAAYQALEAGGSSSVVLNAADEVAVDLFLAAKVPFNHIPRIVLESLETIAPARVETLEQVVCLHEQVVARVREKWDRPGL